MLTTEQEHRAKHAPATPPSPSRYQAQHMVIDAEAAAGPPHASASHAAESWPPAELTADDAADALEAPLVGATQLLTPRAPDTLPPRKRSGRRLLAQVHSRIRLAMSATL